MATLRVNGFEDLTISMGELARIPDNVLEKMLLTEAQTLERMQKTKGESYGVRRTGATLRGITIGKVSKTRSGGREVEVYPKGKNRMGGDIATIASVNNRGREEQMVRVNGKSRLLGAQRKRPFIDDANKEYERIAFDGAAREYERWLNSKNI